MEDVKRWLREGGQSFGLLTGEIAALDFDDREEGRVFFKQHRNKIKSLVVTPRGCHMYFKNDLDLGNRVRVNQTKMDIRANNGFVVCSGSTINGFVYHMPTNLNEVDPKNLTPISELNLDLGMPSGSLLTIPTRGDMTRRIHEYMKKVEPAIQGQSGDTTAFRVACVLVQKFELSPKDAWPFMLQWNEGCQPPWEGTELNRLYRKLEEAERLK